MFLFYSVHYPKSGSEESLAVANLDNFVVPDLFVNAPRNNFEEVSIRTYRRWWNVAQLLTGHRGLGHLVLFPVNSDMELVWRFRFILRHRLHHSSRGRVVGLFQLTCHLHCTRHMIVSRERAALKVLTIRGSRVSVGVVPVGGQAVVGVIRVRQSSRSRARSPLRSSACGSSPDRSRVDPPFRNSPCRPPVHGRR